MTLFVKSPLNTLAKTLVATTILSTNVACQPAADNNQAEPVEKVTASNSGSLQDAAKVWPALDIEVKQTNEIEQRIQSILSTMTLEQKVAQMIQPEIRDISVEDMRKYGFGSYLNGGGAFPNNDKHASVEDWVELAEKMYQASVDDSLDGSSIPTMWGTDAVHGHNNVIGATLFPHNIGLGAAHNPELIEQIAAITAKEVMVTGIDWVFAPTVAVVRDDRWGRSYEGYSEDPEIVSLYSSAIVKGLQGAASEDFLGDQRVIATVKHFLGDGGTVNGDDQGNNIASEQELFDIHAQGYVSGLSVGAQTVMASFNSWHGKKNHGNKYLLTTVLKDRMGFDGLVVGDWNGHGQIEGCSNESCPQTINAGLDIYMVPTDAWKPLYENTIKQVNSGIIPLARIDDAVSRILRVKLRAGLFDKPSPANRVLSAKAGIIGAKEHRDVAKQAVRESLVLLKNKEQLLPLSPTQHILVAGDGADNIGKQSGGWSITWQGTNNKNSDFPGATSIYQGIEAQVKAAGGKVTLNAQGNYSQDSGQKPDVAIVVFGEEPYAEGHGDRDNVEYQRGNKKDLALLKKLKADGIKVVALFISGRPMWVNAELNASDAFVAVWLPGTEGAAISDVIMASKDGGVQHDFVGRLSFSWPNSADQVAVNRHDEDYAPLLPYGFGLNYHDINNSNVLADDLNEVTEQSHETLTQLAIFKGGAKAPWNLSLISGDESLSVSSNVHQFGGLSYRTSDNLVQEDSRDIQVSGNIASGVQLVGNFPEDLRSYLEQESSLAFMVKLNQQKPSPTYVRMTCEAVGDASCQADVNITSTLQTLPVDKWQTLSVPLSCFNDKGLNISQVTSPFTLITEGSTAEGSVGLDMSFSDVSLIPATDMAAIEHIELKCE